MKDHNTFLWKICLSHFYFSKGSKLLLVWDCDKDKGQTEDSGGGLLYWPFLNPRYISIFRASQHFCFSTGREVTAPPTLGNCWRSLDLLIARLRDWPYVYGYLCIYNFITPTRSSGSAFWLSTHASASACLHRRNLCREIPDWRPCQRSLFNKYMIS